MHPDIAVLTLRQEDCTDSARAVFTVRRARTMDRALAVTSIVSIATDVSLISTMPAGTVLTDKAVIDTDGITVLAGCSDNVVRHSPRSVGPRLAGSVVAS